MKIKERYIKNTQAFSGDELEKIQRKKVCIIGCGGLGGHVCQSLARFGVGQLTLVDGDIFCESNLNRQAFANSQTLGQNKARACKEALEFINPEVKTIALERMLTKENAEEILAGHDLVMDCLDDIPARFILAAGCLALNLPFVHGAIGGFYGQVANIFPGEKILEHIYPLGKDTPPGAEKKLGNPSFTPQLVAAIQCGEALKMLAGRQTILRGGMLYIDMLNNHYEFIEIAEPASAKEQ